MRWVKPGSGERKGQERSHMTLNFNRKSGDCIRWPDLNTHPQLEIKNTRSYWHNASTDSSPFRAINPAARETLSHLVFLIRHCNRKSSSITHPILEDQQQRPTPECSASKSRKRAEIHRCHTYGRLVWNGSE
jgi:hypothetical protein